MHIQQATRLPYLLLNKQPQSRQTQTRTNENLQEPPLTKAGQFVHNRLATAVQPELPMKLWFLASLLFSDTDNHRSDAGHALQRKCAGGVQLSGAYLKSP